MIAHLWIFLAQIAHHLVSIVTGAAVSLAILVKEKLTETPIKWKAILFVFLGALGLSLFFAWQDEYTSAEWRGNRISHLEVELHHEQESKKPNFIGELNFTASGQRSGKTFLMVGVGIQNSGGTENGLKNWSMSLQLNDGTVSQGIILPNSRTDIVHHIQGTQESATLKVDEYLPIITMQPIRVGGAVSGWFWAEFPTVKEEDLYSDRTTLIVKFSDIISNQQYVLTRPLGKSGISLP